MGILTYDIEVTPTRSMVGFLDHDTGKITQFEHTQSVKIKKFIKSHTLVGFNNKGYDDLILTAMINREDPYELSKAIIDESLSRWHCNNDVSDSIDLMEVAKGQAGLKLYGARLNAKRLQDLPYNPHEEHTDKMWKEVWKYNRNDLKLTKLLYDYLKPDLSIREEIGAKYGIDVRSRSDAQVAEDVFKKELGITKKPRIEIPKSVHYKAPDYVQFETDELKRLKQRFEEQEYKIDKKTGKFLPIEWMNEKIVIGGNAYTIGVGGLHSNEKNLSVSGPLKNADIASMYPSLIINSGKYPTQLGRRWLDLYEEFRDERMKIKHTDKRLSAMLKIFLNGAYGKLNSKYSILYAPHLMIDTTITGQLTLLMVIERLYLAGITVVSANTDGVEYVDSTTKGEEIIDQVGREANLVWEHASYKELHARDVNSYIAVYDGYVKRKGFFAEPAIDKNPEHPIVQDAIAEYLLNGTPMEETICKCKDPAKFCTSRQVNGGALWSPKEYPNTEEFDKFIVEFEAGTRKDNKALRKRNDNYKKQFILAEANEHYLGKVVRFYYAKGGKPMYYKNGNKVPKSDGCRPMMKLKKKVPKDLDYDKYIELTHTYLKEIAHED